MHDRKLKMIDPHCHLWDLSLGYTNWLSDDEHALLGSLRPINQDYLLQNYRQDSRQFDVHKIVHIEASNQPFVKDEVEWLINLASQAPIIGAIIAGVNLSMSNVDELLSFYAQKSLVKGVRHILNWHEDSKYRAADQKDYLTNPIWLKSFGLLKKHDLSFDLHICPPQMQDAVSLARQFPDTPIIINHAGLPIKKDFAVWKKGIADLSICKNIFMKISGFGMLDHHWTKVSIAGYVNYLIDMFGADRCMFASNFPVDKLYSDFNRLMGSYVEITQNASLSEKHCLFYENAQRIYRIDA